MKTQVFKKSEIASTSNLLMLATMIIFSGILLVANNNKSTFSGNSFSKSITKQENEKLLLNKKTMYEAVIIENETVKTPASEIEFSMEKLHEFLIPENEPELTISIANSIVFPEIETTEPVLIHSEANADFFLIDLKKQAVEKTNAAVEYYAMQKKVKEFLSIETEKPLCLEDWMLNRKCWCPELIGAMALSEGK